MHWFLRLCLLVFPSLHTEHKRTTLTTVVSLDCCWSIINGHKLGVLLFFALWSTAMETHTWDSSVSLSAPAPWGTSELALPQWNQMLSFLRVHTCFDSDTVHLSWVTASWGKVPFVEYFVYLISSQQTLDLDPSFAFWLMHRNEVMSLSSMSLQSVGGEIDAVMQMKMNLKQSTRRNIEVTMETKKRDTNPARTRSEGLLETVMIEPNLKGRVEFSSIYSFIQQILNFPYSRQIRTSGSMCTAWCWWIETYHGKKHRWVKKRCCIHETAQG